MNISQQLDSLSKDHPDADLLVQFRKLVDGLLMYSEAKEPYDVFVWEVETHGELSNDPLLFDYMKVLEKIHGKKSPIRKSSLLQDKHREFFKFDGDKLINKKPSRFYKDKYDAWNRFVERIYTDNGALNKEEIQKMRALAKQVWKMEHNTVRIFEFGSPTIQHYLMGRTENGNWLGIHTMSVET